MNFKIPGMSALVALFSVGAAVAQVADGRYQIGACTNASEDTVVQLEGNVLRFYETLCRLSNPVPAEGTDGFSYAGACIGEGEEWQASIVLIPLQGGQMMRLINDGFVIDYQRCAP
jgi:hypothetical protein